MYNQELPDPTLTKLDIKDWKSFMVGTFKKDDKALEESIGNTLKRLIRISPKIKKSTKMMLFSNGNSFVPVYLASQYGCKINLVTESEDVAKKMEKEVAKYELTEKIDVTVEDYNLTSFTYDHFDMIWSVGGMQNQEKLLHILREVKRLLVPQGRFILCELAKTSEDADAKNPFSNHSFADLLNVSNKADLEKVYEKALTRESVAHYQRLATELENAKAKLKKAVGAESFDSLLSDVKTLSSQSEDEQIAWGFLQFQKRNA